MKISIAILFFAVAITFTLVGCKGSKSNAEVLCSRTLTGEGKSVLVLCWYISPDIADDSVKFRQTTHQLATQINGDLKAKKEDMELGAIYSTKDFDCDKFKSLDQNEVGQWIDYMMNQTPRAMMNGISDAVDTIGIVYYKKDGRTTSSSEKWVVKQ